MIFHFYELFNISLVAFYFIFIILSRELFFIKKFMSIFKDAEWIFIHCDRIAFRFKIEAHNKQSLMDFFGLKDHQLIDENEFYLGSQFHNITDCTEDKLKQIEYSIINHDKDLIIKLSGFESQDHLNFPHLNINLFSFSIKDEGLKDKLNECYNQWSEKQNFEITYVVQGGSLEK